MNFLDHYNNELRHLREAGARFAREHPQIAPALGLRPNSVADPFVERLLEGVAFLSARVQTRLDLECAEFARQALAQVCPLYLSATPAISSFAFHPDFASPEAFRGRSMPRGTLIQATLPGAARPVTFSTGREVTLLPLRLERAECGRGLARISAELARRLASSQAALRLSFKLEGTVALGDLAAVEGGAKPLQLSLAGDLPRAYALHRAMLADVGAWYATADDGRGGATGYDDIGRDSLVLGLRHEKSRQRLRLGHRRRQSDHAHRRRESPQPRQCQRQQIAALRRHQRVEFVEHDALQRREQERRIVRSQQQRHLLRRRQQDIGWIAPLPLPA